MITCCDMFKRYAVTGCATLEEFLDQYYKPARYKLSPMHHDFPDYAAIVLESHRQTLAEHGCDWIGPYESITGRCVSFYPPEPATE